MELNKTSSKKEESNGGIGTLFLNCVAPNVLANTSIQNETLGRTFGALRTVVTVSAGFVYAYYSKSSASSDDGKGSCQIM